METTAKPGWSDGFIINFGLGADQPWQPPSPEVSGWHKDGDFFRHFLDSPEQGLLTIVVWSDIYPKERRDVCGMRFRPARRTTAL